MEYYYFTANFGGRVAYLSMDFDEHKEFYRLLSKQKYKEAALKEVTFFISYRSPDFDAEYTKSNEDFSNYYVWDRPDKVLESPFLDIYDWKSYVNCFPPPMMSLSENSMRGSRLISERVKNIFDKYIVSPHIYFAVNLKYKEEQRKYYIFSYLGVPKTTLMDVTKMIFDVTSRKDDTKYETVEGKDFSNWKDFHSKTRHMNLGGKKLVPRQHIYKNHFDIFPSGVNEKVINDLISQNIQIKKRNYVGPEIIMPK